MFTTKARSELLTWGLSERRYLDVPHGYQQLGDALFAVLLTDLVQEISRRLGGAV
jgi:hypothetical protein